MKKTLLRSIGLTCLALAVYASLFAILHVSTH